MIIDQLPNGAPFSTSDELAIEKGQTTYKGTVLQLRDALALQGVNGGILNANWLNLNYGANNGGTKFVRCATTPNAAMGANIERSIGTLPDGYRPSYQINHCAVVTTDGIIAMLKITTAGVATITPFSAIAADKNIYINLAYI